ncbi:tetratricopeptide repeat protein [Microbacterium sp. SLBN-154]|uniref:tetratricopeptide repeat protein n=1 Tax=Microbacterium sp. SLBN-154 TaxID=2768458 RepID=UPI001153A3B4|nr:tetratricopeptide repeat protein [Microbacterium sp. SLBN-154]TQK19216.1 tetratricopeptide repeat protein [Microbacterium sp. SLBN-154]
MTTRIGVAVMAVLLALYIALVAQRAWLLLTSGDPVGIALGAGLLLLPVIAAWALWRELAFGIGAERLGRRLETEGGLPVESVTIRPSGRPIREDGEAVFPTYRDAVEQNPSDWQAWYRLGLAYDAAGDRRRARQAVREAIRRERQGRAGS